MLDTVLGDGDTAVNQTRKPLASLHSCGCKVERGYNGQEHRQKIVC